MVGVRSHSAELCVRYAVQPLRSSSSCRGVVPFPARQASPGSGRTVHGLVIDIGGAVVAGPSALQETRGGMSLVGEVGRLRRGRRGEVGPGSIEILR